MSSHLSRTVPSSIHWKELNTSESYMTASRKCVGFAFSQVTLFGNVRNSDVFSAAVLGITHGSAQQKQRLAKIVKIMPVHVMQMT